MPICPGLNASHADRSLRCDSCDPVNRISKSGTWWCGKCRRLVEDDPAQDDWHTCGYQMEWLLWESPTVAALRAGRPEGTPPENGNIFVFCDFVDVSQPAGPVGCLRGAGHDGPHAFAPRHDRTGALLGPVLLRADGRASGPRHTQESK